MTLPQNPLRSSQWLGRIIRQDGIETLGISSQTLAERYALAGKWELAKDMALYYWDELWRMGQTLYTWMDDIHAFRLRRWGTPQSFERGGRILVGLRDFDPSSGERARMLEAIQQQDPLHFNAGLENMRLRWVSVHDALVFWIEHLLADIAAEWGEQAVYEAVVQAYDRLWKPRYETWFSMSPIERVQLSVEGMRGRMSGPRRRGDVGIREEDDRFVLSFNPCGSCGVLRRGDPDSGRPPLVTGGNQQPHPWSAFRTGVGWYSLHSPMVMEYLPMSSGLPPFRPLDSCDGHGPCTWFIYKNPARTRSEHFQKMGFAHLKPGEQHDG